uniref:Peptidase A1 domain-containing protein n=1 Tax=Lactuca sativa TaxID=4236 RepID=A0A9R1WN70_LACSA|nr:hypothetical protein LSAT_V11C100041100 [Lactuca sativa]
MVSGKTDERMRISYFVRNMVTFTLLGAGVFLLLQAVVQCEFPATLRLERAFPANHPIELSHLRDGDSFRHQRILRGVTQLSVYGTYDPLVAGLYFTTITLGSPPKDYHVQIDTGSDVLWIGCKPCKECPTSSGLEIPVTLYDPSRSSTSSPISCSDERCSPSDKSNSCSHDWCTYNINYEDGSGTSGHYVSDLMHFEIFMDTESSINISASVVFGCSTSETGRLTKTKRPVDGILGLGQQGLSIMSQLSSQGIAPTSFSHCLADGGGLLVLGKAVVPNMVFTPLVKSKWHYNVNLESISVDGQTMSIDPSVFALNHDQTGTIIDSGTTLVYLTKEAYTPVVEAIKHAVSQSIQPLISKDYVCYSFPESYSFTTIFPTVSFNFAGGASMHLRPCDYLLRQISMSGARVWCMGILPSREEGITILGDLVLRDKVIVYDLGGQQIGWADRDCKFMYKIYIISFSIFNISAGGSSLRISCNQLILTVVISCIVHLTMMLFASFFHLFPH